MTDLSRMLTLQRDLQANTYGRDLGMLSDHERVQFIKDMVLAASDELHEALNEVSWKPWTQGDARVNEDALFSELIDLWHFVMNLFLVTRQDLSPAQLADRIMTAYEDKRAVNAQRQRDGYDGVAGKCRGCRRALDDKSVLCGDIDEDNDMWCEDNAAWYGSTGLRVY